MDPDRNIDDRLDILIQDGLIAALEKPMEKPMEKPGEPARADTVIEAKGRLVLPGLIDPHVHLREPGHEYKETVASGLAAAAAGGFTAVAAMPNTSPPMDTAEEVAALLVRARAAGGSRVWPVAAMTKGRRGEELTEYYDLKTAGAVAVSDDGDWVKNPRVFRRVLDYAATVGLSALSHSEDPDLSRGGAILEGRVSTRLGLPGIPAQAESLAVLRDLGLAELTGRPLHLCHLSTRASVEALRAARAKGLPVTGETAPHYLFLTHEDVGDYDPNAKMKPPLGTAEDQAALRVALADGTLSALATDHAPHSVLEKEVEFIDASFGVIGLETALPLALELTRSGLISLSRLVELMSLNPARILGVHGGSLAPGQPADVTVVDPDLDFALEPSGSRSLSRNSPFWGRPLRGRATHTLVDGRLVYELK